VGNRRAADHIRVDTAFISLDIAILVLEFAVTSQPGDTRKVWREWSRWLRDAAF
jgi:hypothetical protein